MRNTIQILFLLKQIVASKDIFGDYDMRIGNQLTVEQKNIIKNSVSEFTRLGLTTQPCRLYREIEAYILNKEQFVEGNFDFYEKLRLITGAIGKAKGV